MQTVPIRELRESFAQSVGRQPNLTDDDIIVAWIANRGTNMHRNLRMIAAVKRMVEFDAETQP